VTAEDSGFDFDSVDVELERWRLDQNFKLARRQLALQARDTTAWERIAAALEKIAEKA
jgi:hypothetical protein